METIQVPSKFPGVQLVEIGDGPTLIQNSDVVVTIYLGDDNSVSALNASQNVPLSPQSFLVVDGTREVWAIAASGTILVHKIRGGLSFFQSGINGTGFIINSQGIFVYSTNPPAAGTLTESIAPFSGLDSFVNEFDSGFTAYSGNNPGDNFMSLQNAAILAGINSNQPTGTAGIFFAGGAQFRVLNVLLATDPVLGNAPETWHTITLDAGWSTAATNPVPSYRLTSDGDCEIAGYATHTSFSGTVALNSSNPLPSQYRPTTNQHQGAYTNTGGCGIALLTTGVVQVEATVAASTSARFTARFPLNL